MRRFVLAFVALAVACSPETPAPPPAPTTQTAPPATASQPPAATTTRIPELLKGTYDEALLWMRSTRHYRFVVTEGKVRAEGEMNRKTPGAEKVTFRSDGQSWEAAASLQGVTWKRNGKPADPPSYGGRIYQRVTVVFDPQKKEGVPMLVSSEGETNLYRFTDANSGAVHEVWVRKADSSIARMKIGEDVEIVFEP